MSKLIIEAEIDSKGAVVGLKSIQKEVDKTAREVEKSGKKVDTFVGSFKPLLAMTAGMAGISTGIALIGQTIKNNIQTAKQFEASMSNLRALTGLYGKDLEFLGDQAKRLGATTTQSATQVVEAMKLIGSQKPELLKSKEALANVTAQAITLAQAAGMEVPEAATALTSALNQMGASAEQSGEYINIMAAASQQGAGDINYINQAVVKAGATANMAKVQFNELVAAIEGVASGGYDASTAGTSLRNVFLRLEKQANDKFKPSVVGLNQALKNLADANLDTKKKADLFGAQNIAVADTLIKQRTEVEKLTEAITGTRTAYDQSAINTDNFAGSISNLNSAWEGLNLSINQSNGALKSFIDSLTLLATYSAEGIGNQRGIGASIVDAMASQKLDEYKEQYRKFAAEMLADGMDPGDIMAEIYNKIAAELERTDNISKGASKLGLFDLLSKEKTDPIFGAMAQNKALLQLRTSEDIYNIANGITPKTTAKSVDEYNPDAAELTKEAARKAQELHDLREEQVAKAERDERDYAYKVAQAKIDAMEAGADKERAQITLDYVMECDAIQRGEEDVLATREKYARKAWELQNQDETKTWTNSGAQAAYRRKNVLTGEDKEQSEALLGAAQAKYEAKIKAFYRTAADEHASYYDRRAKIEAEYQKTIEDLAKRKDGASTEDAARLDRAIVQAGVERAKNLLAVSMEELKTDPAFVEAFEDLNNVATSTLDNLYNRLAELKPLLADLPADQLKEITDLMRRIQDTKLDRTSKPIKQLVEALDELSKARENGNEDEVVKAQNKVDKAYQKVRKDVDELNAAIRSLGDTIGGEVGEVLGFIADVGDFVKTTIDGIKLFAEASAQAISTAEKAVAILAIIEAAIKVFQKLTEITEKFSDAGKNAALVEKQKEVNALTQSVNAYAYAARQAALADETWFGDSALKNLQNMAELHKTAYDNYFAKLNEDQVKYRNKSRNDDNWTMTAEKIIGWTTAGAGLSNLVNADGLIGAYVNDIGTGATKNLTSARDNLVIQTRAKKNSFFGFGGHDQKTKNLEEWLVDKYGQDAKLFDADGFINIELATSIIDNYGDKLQGETQDTLEALIALKEQYDEYMESLREYISNLYDPLADNMVNALWDWVDNGKDALDSFRDYASETFRSIVNDLMKQIVLKDIVGTFSDNVTELYNTYFSGKLSAAELMQKVAKETSGLMERYNTGMPGLTGLLDQINAMLDEIGINTAGTGEATATINAVKSVSEDTANQLVGRMTAIQLSTEAEKATYQAVASNIYASLEYTAGIATAATEGAETLDDIRSLMVTGNEYLADIVKYSKATAERVTADLERIATNTDKL